MIKSLEIRNYAIIEKQRLDFDDELNIITGETGAGKSIILGALELILGQRAQGVSLFNPKEKCVIEGEFDITNDELESYFQEKDLDYDDQLIVRREVLPSGKSRAFVNDSPCNLETLSNLAEKLIDLHHQFDTQQIGSSAFQTAMLDALAKQKKTLQSYQEDYKRWRALTQQLSDKSDAIRQSAQRLDFVKFQYDEVSQLALRESEGEEIEAQLRLEESGEQRKTALLRTVFALKEGSAAILSQLADVTHELEGFKELDADMAGISERMSSTLIELEDIAGAAERLAEDIEYDEQSVVNLRDRLDVINRLFNKHHVRSTDELLQLCNQWEKEIEDVESGEESLHALEEEIKSVENKLRVAADKLSKGRTAQIKKVEKIVIEKLHFLNMKHAEFKIEMEKNNELGPLGADHIMFKFSANPGMPLKAIHLVASGGELSRLALVLKSLVAAAIPLPTLIFDEIDSGISGDVSSKMASILMSISEEHQVVCITHSPQIASKGEHHMHVFKTIADNRTTSDVRALTEEERIHHIAVMLSSDPPSTSAIRNAKELIHA